MAEICRFLGIIIAMFADDHNPPHFHIRYGEYKAFIAIDGSVIKGIMPKNVLKNVFQWMEEHQEELYANWERMQNGEEIIKIEPLDK